MRKIILSVAVSLDGFIEGPKGEYDWCFTDQDYGMKDFFKRIDAIFMGRKTYEMALAMGDGGTGFSKMKTYVFSNTLKTVKGDDILIADDLKKQVDEIKSQKGKDIWLFGGAGLTTSLMKINLVDEISLAVHPILLGSGTRLFSGISDRINLVLTDTQNYSTGLVTLTYTLK